MQIRNDKADSIDALHRGGQVCSSDEVTVMVMEQRGLATTLKSNSQLVIGGAV